MNRNWDREPPATQAEFVEAVSTKCAEMVAAERRAALERIRERLDAKRSEPPNLTAQVRWSFTEMELRAILDEEAAR